MIKGTGPRPYSPGPSPNSAAQIPLYINTELLKIAGVLQALAEGFLAVTYTEPKKVQEGAFRLAAGHVEDVAHWSPDGSGDRAIYQYRMTTAPDTYGWIKVG